MKSNRFSLTAVAAALVLLAPIAGAATSAWSIVDLGSAHNLGTMALNDLGWVAMGNKVLSPGAGGYTSVEVAGRPGSSGLRLMDINNANAVVGWDYSSGLAQGFIWEAGVRTDLPPQRNYLGEFTAQAKGINDRGQVVGNTGDYAAIWSPNPAGGYTATTLGWYWEGTRIGSGDGIGINDAGAGLMATVYNQYRPGYTIGLGNGISILRDGLVELPVGTAINDHYAVAGSGTYNCSGYACNRPYIWTSGDNVAFLPLTPDPGKPYNGRANALNESNDVVGMGWYGPYDGRAVLWSASAAGWQEIDLNTVLPSGSPFWKLTEAMDINERGQILGMGAVHGDWQPHAFLLTPAVPEPESWMLILGGLAWVRWAVRRRAAAHHR